MTFSRLLKYIAATVIALSMPGMAFAATYTTPWTATSTSDGLIFSHWNGQDQSPFVPTVIASYYTATSSAATSTFLGNVMIGNSLFNGQLAKEGIFGTLTPLQVSTNVNDLSTGLTVGNTNNGIYAGSCITFENDRSNNLPLTLGESYFGATCYSSGEFNNPILAGFPANSFGTILTDGSILAIAASSNPASSTFVWAIGPGYAQGNYDMVLKNVSFDNITNLANGGLGLGSTTPDARFAGEASTTAGFPFLDFNTQTNGVQNPSVYSLSNAGVSSSTNLVDSGVGENAAGTFLAATKTGSIIATTAPQAAITLTTTGSSGASTFTNNVLNIPQYSGGSSQWTGTVGSPIYYAQNVGIGSSSPWAQLSVGIPVYSATQPMFAIGSSTSSGTTTPFIVSASGQVGIKNASPSHALDIGGSGLVANIANTGWYGIGGNLLAYASSTNQDTVFGLQAGGQSATTSAIAADNVAVGYQALTANVTSAGNNGVQNTAVGYQALGANTTGSYNVAVGYTALPSNTGGNSNAAFGVNALQGNNTGNFNTAIGDSTDDGAGTASYDTALGFEALGGDYSGGYNVAVGASALTSESSAAFNTVVGANAFSSASLSGGSNSALGYQAGSSDTSGKNNVYLGYQAASSTLTGSNNIVIGYNLATPSLTSSNVLDIGNLIYGGGLTSQGTSSPAGYAGIGTSTPSSHSVFQVTETSTSTNAAILVGTPNSVGGEIILVDATTGHTTCTEIYTVAGAVLGKSVSCPTQ